MRTIDLLVVSIYLLAVIAVGIAYRGKTESVDEYFTAQGVFRGRLGTLIIGFSIAATFMSGISIIVYVSTAFSDGARIGLGLLCLPIAWVLLLQWFLPRYLRGGWRHPYEVVEQRFGSATRMAISAMFFLLRLGWMAVMISVPALIVMGSLGLDQRWFWPIVLGVGLSSTSYTVLGGIRGVIITDAIQFVVILGGMLLILILIIARLDLPLIAVWHDWDSRGRLNLFDFSLDLTRPFTFWTVVIGLSIANLGTYLADQMSLQRYLLAESPKDAARAFTVNVVGVAVVISSLVCVGLLLSTWYNRYPDANLPAEADKVLAYFIVHELPAGFSGLLIAAILAATMSSMTSCINSLAGVLTNDWLVRFGRPRSSAELYRFGRGASLAIGVFATIISGFAANMGTVMDVQVKVMGAFLGPMLACIMLSVIDRVVPVRLVFYGIVAGVIAGWAVALSPLASLWVPPISFICAITPASLGLFVLNRGPRFLKPTSPPVA